MTKGYVAKISYRRDPQDRDKRITDVDFTSDIEKAGCRNTEQEAQSDCTILDNVPITIMTAEGKPHVCKNFQYEQRRAGEYVLFCEAPFVKKEETFNAGFKYDLQSFGPVAIKRDQKEVTATHHDTWGEVACPSCSDKFLFGGNRIYGTRGNGTPDDYAKILTGMLEADHKRNKPHQNSYELGEI
jgi:hypothetical protein